MTPPPPGAPHETPHDPPYDALLTFIYRSSAPQKRVILPLGKRDKHKHENIDHKTF